MDEQKFDLYIDGDIAAENMTIETAVILLEALFVHYYSEVENGMEITIKGRKQKGADV
jgi:hypothetical protein